MNTVMSCAALVIAICRIFDFIMILRKLLAIQARLLLLAKKVTELRRHAVDVDQRRLEWHLIWINNGAFYAQKRRPEGRPVNDDHAAILRSR